MLHLGSFLARLINRVLLRYGLRRRLVRIARSHFTDRTGMTWTGKPKVRGYLY